MNSANFSKLFNIKKFHSSYIASVAQENDIGVGCLVFIKALSIKDFNSQQEISKFIGCNKAHTSRILTKLQEKQYITFSNGKNQNIKISLTEKGKLLAKKVADKDKEYAKKLVEGIDKNDLDVFKKVCNQIYENSEKLTNI